jgi:hypothetical protein
MFISTSPIRDLASYETRSKQAAYTPAFSFKKFIPNCQRTASASAKPTGSARSLHHSRSLHSRETFSICCEVVFSTLYSFFVARLFFRKFSLSSSKHLINFSMNIAGKRIRLLALKLPYCCCVVTHRRRGTLSTQPTFPLQTLFSAPTKVFPNRAFLGCDATKTFRE